MSCLDVSDIGSDANNSKKILYINGFVGKYCRSNLGVFITPIFGGIMSLLNSFGDAALQQNVQAEAESLEDFFESPVVELESKTWFLTADFENKE